MTGWLDHFISVTLKGFLIIFGLATCLPILVAYNLEFANARLFFGLLEYTPSSVPALRHWGIMVFGIGALMVVAAFRPWLRFEAMIFSAVEKAFMVYLFLISSAEPWANAYVIAFVTDLTIVIYSIAYLFSSVGRPHKWTISD